MSYHQKIYEQLFHIRAEVQRLTTIADSNAAHGIEAEKQVKALEAEIGRWKKQLVDCLKNRKAIREEMIRLKRENIILNKHIKQSESIEAPSIHYKEDHT